MESVGGQGGIVVGMDGGGVGEGCCCLCCFCEREVGGWTEDPRVVGAVAA